MLAGVSRRRHCARAISPDRPATATTTRRGRATSRCWRASSAPSARSRASRSSAERTRSSRRSRRARRRRDAAVGDGAPLRHAAQRDLRRAASRSRRARASLSRSRAARRRTARPRRASRRRSTSADVAAVFVQRSRGYAPRPSLAVDGCGAHRRCVARASQSRPLVLVDNCYGELVEEREPTHAGADLVMGSLIKNLGGSTRARRRLRRGTGATSSSGSPRACTRPDLGDALGPTLGFRPRVRARLVLAPLVVEQTLARSRLHGGAFSRARLSTWIRSRERVRTDIVQAIRLASATALIRFAAGLQKAMPVNARFRPEPGPVPGYARSGRSCRAAPSSAARRSNSRATRRCANRTRSTCKAACRRARSPRSALCRPGGWCRKLAGGRIALRRLGGRGIRRRSSASRRRW